MIPELSVGIDYHQNSLQVCVLKSDGKVQQNRKIRNDVEELLKMVGVKSTGVVVTAEACNGSASLLDAVRSRTNWQVKLCHPGYAQRMRNNPDKSDKSDGELIADLTRVGYLPEVWLAPEELRDLRALVRYRALKVKESSKLKVRIRALLRNNRIRPPLDCGLWSKLGWAWLQTGVPLPEHSAWILSRYLSTLIATLREIHIVTARLGRYAKKDSLCQKLLQHTGIGVITAVAMRSEIGTFTRFRTGKQLSRYCGLSPCNRSSGQVVSDSGVIRAGNLILKNCITQGTWSVIRHDPHWRAFANSLLEKGKPKSVVASAVANRWIRKLFHEVKNL